VIFERSIVPYLGGFNQCNQYDVFPIVKGQFWFGYIRFFRIQQFLEVHVCYDWHLLFHFPSHDHKLNKILNVLSFQRPQRLIQIVVKTCEILHKRFDFKINFKILVE